LSYGFEHVPFDAALVASLAHAFPGEPIQFFGEREHLAQTRRFLEERHGGADVSWRELALPPAATTPSRRLVADVRACLTALAEAKRVGARQVICCYLPATTGTLVAKALSLVHRACPIAIIFHGNIMRLLWSRRYRPLLSLGNRRSLQIALGGSIRRELLTKVPELSGSLHAIRHPYFFADATPSQLPSSGPITFSYLGLVDLTKGSREFAELAASMNGDGRARFDMVGGVRPGDFDMGPAVKRYVENGPLERAAYERRLRETGYAVFPYQPDYYKLVASGAVLDAFSAGKPIIALRNSQFEEMFDSMGDIGYLCDDMPAMRSLVEGLLQEPPRERYRRQSETILARRVLYGPEAVGEQLRSILTAGR
jgi:hypothetical protein